MKFGKRLLRQLHPEWATFYVDYRALKQELKQALLFGDVKGAVWFNMLQTELQKVNRFFLEKESMLSKQFVQYEGVVANSELSSSFAEFCRQLELLRYFVVLNYIAIYKITKKRNKMLSASKPIDFLPILLEQPFYNSIKLARITVKTELLALKLMPGETLDEKNFSCPICLDVLCNPVVLSCTHRFCWSCLSKTSESIQACPVCRKDQHLDPSNFNIDWILKEFLGQRFPESQAKEVQLPQMERGGLMRKLEQRASNLVSFSSHACSKKQKTEEGEEKKATAAGRVADCKYTLVKKVGEGVFGQVFLAVLKDDKSGTKFALKKLAKNHPKFKKSTVVREIAAGKRLRQENIVKFYESFETTSSVYLVMEFFDGQDLYTILEDRNYKPYPEYSARDIFKQLLQALLHCHQSGIAHRDVKLENILMNNNGRIRLIDFGLCESVVDSSNNFVMCTETVGSPAYIAPEILTGRPYNGLKADVWSTGVVLYALLYGRFPFSAVHYKNLVQGDPVPVTFPESGVCQGAKQILTAMLRLDPNARVSLMDVHAHEWVTPPAPIATPMDLAMETEERSCGRMVETNST